MQQWRNYLLIPSRQLRSSTPASSDHSRASLPSSAKYRKRTSEQLCRYALERGIDGTGRKDDVIARLIPANLPPPPLSTTSVAAAPIVVNKSSTFTELVEGDSESSEDDAESDDNEPYN